MNPQQIANGILSFLSQLSGPAAYTTIVGILLICGFGVPIPEDITLLSAGLLASGGAISLPGAFLAGFAGVIVGDATLFFLGRRYGKKVFNLPGLRKIMTPDRIAAAEERIRRNGPFICFIARFLPGLRTPIFAMAGALGVKPHVFLGLDGLAALISVPVWIYLGYWFGSNLEEALKKAEHIQMFILAGLVIGVSFYLTWGLWRRRRRRAAAAALESVVTTPSVPPRITDLQNRERIGDSDSSGSQTGKRI
jgi:membrane protein DedA with SNARE-associated domain